MAPESDVPARIHAIRAGLRDLSTSQIRHVRAVRYREATNTVLRIYQELEREFGVLAPPVALHSPAPEALAASWMMVRETILVDNGTSRSHKESVSAVVSARNDCQFCETMHSGMLRDQLRRNKADRLGAESVGRWARSSAPFDKTLLEARQTPELVGTLVTLEYLNRMVNVFLGELPLPPGAPRAALTPVRRLLVWLMAQADRDPPRAGASLGLLPSAQIPQDLSWSAGNKFVAEAFSRSAAAMERAGCRVLEPPARKHVATLISQWDGSAASARLLTKRMPLDKVERESRAAVRLALCTAFASHEVSRRTVDAYREEWPEDRQLIELTAWASFTAARHMGNRAAR